MPNPLTDEHTDQAKQELAAVFADMRRRYQPRVTFERRVDERGRTLWTRIDRCSNTRSTAGGG